MTYRDLTSAAHGESSAQIRVRVLAAQRLQQKRFASEPWFFNSQIPSGRIEQFCALDKKGAAYMERVYEKLQLSARAYHKILKVARTIADLDVSEMITVRHLTEAVCYRSLDKKFWEV